MHVVGSDCMRNMWIYFGPLMVLMISGGAQENNIVRGVVSESVLLPCNCTYMNLSRVFTWQKGVKNIAIIYNSSNIVINTTYTGRVELFLNESNNNCSLLLGNIRADDQARYQCSYFKKNKDYDRVFVNLEVFERIITSSESKRLFQCRAFTSNPNTEIRWRLNGTFLNSSPEANISSTGPTNFYGIYIFNSTLTTRTDITPQPECVPQDKTDPKGRGSTSSGQQPLHRTCSEMCIISLFMLVLGLCLVAFLCRRKMGYGRARHVEPSSGDSSFLEVENPGCHIF